ncbi:hypothetical protein AYO20_02537 [Fonsecaea nubica]|uniref:Carrier domain-containing protein n=1 Tax=Fonsecaea nubica TaxID=856822 RepID=A0A178DAF0_9EURO|nr:hypothetical protein AYO20_02537 [Fonsecaea nubica]OAL38085.1 hypothetical protein AYO20_02537 [Fonsecaea nubica]
MSLNYFTCTLDRAALHQREKRYSTIGEFISVKAQTCPDVPVLGLYKVTTITGKASRAAWTPHVWTFKDVYRGVNLVAQALLEAWRWGDNTRSKTQLSTPGPGPGLAQTVAVLCPSSPGLLFTWLGLIWLGHPVLLVAPQCSPSAIAELCRSCNVEVILYEEPYGTLAREASREASSHPGERCLVAHPIPFARDNIFHLIKGSSPVPPVPPATVRDTDVAYLHHTSGTSSGVPKPIPQTHRAAVGVLPILDGTGQATFTTTPLYHGGVADLFRAWTSNALVWPFPGKDLPITAVNVCRCLDVASSYPPASSSASPTNDGRAVPEIKYFSSVPYVLQMMADDEIGREYLRGMDVVGVGGAALPKEVGDILVSDNVKLVSRFGSAECGFLLSSHRDYAKDREWQYLRATPTPGSSSSPLLKFEPRDQEEEGLFELVIQAGWPHMAKRNREDGSFATADLFTAHPTIPDAWRYHSRADSQLTLITGKKFDPAPVEDAIRASASSVLQDILIFGNGRPYPGALLFPHQKLDVSEGDLVRQVAPVIEDLNRKSQTHARIARNMLVPMAPLEGGLEKSSKGTVLRSRAEARFAEAIDAAYAEKESLPKGVGVSVDSSPEVSDSDIPARIREIVENVVCAGGRNGNSDGDSDGDALTEHTDLFAYGVDSVASIQIRRALFRLLPRGSALSLTVVQDTGTIAELSDLILRVRSGRGDSTTRRRQCDEQAQHRLMLDLVDEYSVFDEPGTERSSSPPVFSTGTGLHSSQPPLPNVLQDKDNGKGEGIHVLLTGPTGSLGAHILHQLLASASISKIHLLVRGATPTASCGRVVKALTSRRLPVPGCFDTKTKIHSCNLSDSRLGLSDETYEQLTREVDVIVHLAWSVNFLLPLRAFAQTHLAGTRNLINLATRSSSSSSSSSSKWRISPRFIFCSSVAAVSGYSSPSSSPPSSTSSCSASSPSSPLYSSRSSSSPTTTITSHQPIPESILSDPAVSGPTGYAQSKWVAEQICHRAARDSSRLKNRISVARVGQLSGASDTGVWSRSEAYPLILNTLAVTGCLPDLDQARRDQGHRQGEALAWLPVDVAARAFVEDMLKNDDDSSSRHSQWKDHLLIENNVKDPLVATTATIADTERRNGSLPDVAVHHVLNPSTRVTWSDLLVWVSRHYSQSPIEIVSVDEWLSRLSDLQDSSGAADTETHNHPALRLLGFWEKVYGGVSRRMALEQHPEAEAEAGESEVEVKTGEEKQPHPQPEKGVKDAREAAVHYEMAKTFERMPVLRNVQELINEDYVLKLWEWIRDNI